MVLEIICSQASIGLQCNKREKTYGVYFAICRLQTLAHALYCKKNATGLRPIYVMFFKFLPISFQMKNNDDMWLCLKQGEQKSQILRKRKPIYPLQFACAWPFNIGQKLVHFIRMRVRYPFVNRMLSNLYKNKHNVQVFIDE